MPEIAAQRKWTSHKHNVTMASVMIIAVTVTTNAPIVGQSQRIFQILFICYTQTACKARLEHDAKSFAITYELMM